MSIDTALLTESARLFAVLAAELTGLFLLISYAVGYLQTRLPPERIQRILSDKHGHGYIAAGFLGAITPFCSCSTIPFLKGLLRAKAGFGTMLVFLFASPLLNPIIIGLFAVTFGPQVTLFYFVIAMSVSVGGGIVLEKLGFEKYVKPQSYQTPSPSECNTGCGGKTEPIAIWKKVWLSTWSDFKRVLPFLLGGIAVGSLIYGFMPTEFVAQVASEKNPFAIPVAAMIGIPLYIRAEAVIPLSAALTAKGMGLGAVMALIIGSAGASLTEVILLKSIFRNQMIAAFLVVILGMATGAGFLYHFLF
ncbi:permease [Microbulbifer spongiae]|uniref:Permease n=1 Tax=Microbulbifer spongiae TaxID=2944933 RepID=A0ABY9EHI7_9GAMM|nr:permease [Microbulbifer sp. MI-G]WKD50975.1 permease [Microbulbifer sp. MI-G]